MEEPTLPRLQRKLYRLLSTGKKYSAADMARILYLCDPRGHISQLRKRGVPIVDEWVQNVHNVRYKRYFLKQRNDGTNRTT